jgi:hypothetical protein
MGGEICNMDGEVFKGLSNNYADWLEKLTDSSMALTFTTTDGTIYVVSRYYEEGSLLIVTNDEFGPSASREGVSGYYYSLSGELNKNNASKYTQTYMGNNIWCYKKD